MPLLKGKANVGKNIKTELKAGVPRAQAIAIALSVAGKSKSKLKGKGPNELPKKSIPHKKGNK
jgi:hypothetical protein